MVKLEEVPDEALIADQPGPLDEEGDWDTDSESDLESELSIPEDETLYERIQALQDMVSPRNRRLLSSTFSSASAWFKSGAVFGGKALWVVSTSALLLGVPWALAYAEEQQMVEMEREMKQQQIANEVSRNTGGMGMGDERLIDGHRS
ncbi:hypothetical protein W97_03331 [Coniosporium apollinis CBS 100218]|uniref:Mitochondrial import receptor subunit tom22 n=1 Tax=Coniosporium apollinis (strain CBS 100218) TaxID=1168221 RepID=R7YR54_CONA1|nr:uncharacterized protein W97_03331 [Coniosporium apollinis CBS 100218]EON64101.1 hypothetical protein W97_03331 [Coniosporium apollinis CBS 100218]